MGRSNNNIVIALKKNKHNAELRGTALCIISLDKIEEKTQETKKWPELLKKLKNIFLDTNSIKIYGNLQVSRFISVARIKKTPKISKILKSAIKWLKTKKRN